MTTTFGQWLEREMRKRGLDNAQDLVRATGGKLKYATAYGWLSGRTKPTHVPLRLLEDVGINYMDALIAADIIGPADLTDYQPPLNVDELSRRELLEALWRKEDGDETTDASN